MTDWHEMGLDCLHDEQNSALIQGFFSNANKCNQDHELHLTLQNELRATTFWFIMKWQWIKSESNFAVCTVSQSAPKVFLTYDWMIWDR